MNIVIDPEFSSLIPPLMEEEFAGLEKSIKEEGCRDALVVWSNDDKQILIDGHNRYKICQKHGIEFKTIEKKFDCREDALIWMIKTQTGKRNLDKWQKFDLYKRLGELERARAKKRQGARNDLEHIDKKDEAVAANIVEMLPQCSNKSSTNLPTAQGIVVDGFKHNTQSEAISPKDEEYGKTRDKIGKLIGVSGRTYDKMKLIDEKGSEQLKQQVRNGDKSINGAFNEIVKKDSKKLPSAAEYREQVQARHDELKEKKTVSISDIVRDKRDVELLSSEIKSDFQKAFKPVNQLYVLISSKELDISLLNETDKKSIITSIDQTASLLGKVKVIVNGR